MGSVIHVQFPDDEDISILESSMPPCSQNADVVHHSSDGVYDVDGKRFVEIEMRRDATTYLFIPSKSHADCSPKCCFTFSPVVSLSTGAVRSTAIFPTATAGRSLPSATNPGTVTSPSRSLPSASSLATTLLHGTPSSGGRTVLPPIENKAAMSMHVPWVSKTVKVVAPLGIAFWLRIQ